MKRRRTVTKRFFGESLVIRTDKNVEQVPGTQMIKNDQGYIVWIQHEHGKQILRQMYAEHAKDFYYYEGTKALTPVWITERVGDLIERSATFSQNIWPSNPFGPSRYQNVG